MAEKDPTSLTVKDLDGSAASAPIVVTLRQKLGARRRIQRTDQAEVVTAYSPYPVKGESAWCDTCEMNHPKVGCPPLRKWWVNLVTEESNRRTHKSVGAVEARSALAAMDLALVTYGHLQVNDQQRIAVDTDDYFRTAWDRLLDDELGI
jgi:hypothetical protein